MNLRGLRIHGAMLADAERNKALARAIEAVVRPGDVVVDVGAGSAILSMLAVRAGASRVYAVEGGAMALAARRLVARNGLAAAIQVVQAHSLEYQPPEPADVILCETIGFAGLDEGFRRSLVDARTRMLRPGGRILPRRLHLLAAAVTPQTGVADLGRLDDLLGFDFGPLADAFRRLHARCHIPLESELSVPVAAFRLDCRELAADDPLAAQVELEIERGGALGGFGLWFAAELADGVWMTSRSPSADNHWGQVYLPLAEPRRVERGARVRLGLELEDAGASFRIDWRAEIAP